MKKWQVYGPAPAALVAWSPALWAQAIPGVGAAGVPAGAAAPVAGAAGMAPAGATPPSNLWSFLCPTPEQKKKCQDCFCNSPLGQLLNNATAPLSPFSGGLVTGLCPSPNQPNPDDLKKDPEGPEGVAARIKKMEGTRPADHVIGHGSKPGNPRPRRAKLQTVGYNQVTAQAGRPGCYPVTQRLEPYP
jgi:hypothetical protein